ncbi:ROK family protein [Priestia megaterium]|uniref:ROK family protein n=1 Tax=Priestia megaterium TaxID=1404 RepID=UPI002E210843|nr:ROK family protein [Priestia megaterium]
MPNGDAAYIKKLNRSLIISKIVEAGMISRAELSKATALTKATISAQVASLLEEDIIIETQQDYSNVGRKPIMLSLNETAGYALGIDLDYGQISFTLSNLLGRPVSSDKITIHDTNYSSIFSVLVKKINEYKDNCLMSRYGLIGIAISIHGLVTTDEIIHYIPRLQWRDIALKEDLEAAVKVNVYLENNANLLAFAERAYTHHKSDNLVCITLRSGIGLGILINNNLSKGHDGYAGEIGHMIVQPNGELCACGNKGCWEKYASESSFLKNLSQRKQVRNMSFKHIEEELNRKDIETHQEMENFIHYLSIGLNNVINIYNPEILIIDSELLSRYPDSIQKIKSSLSSSISHYRELLISSTGKKAYELGACALVIKHFLEITMPNLVYSESAESYLLK